MFGWGQSGDGPYYRVQQGAAEQSEQSAETAGPARDGGQPSADTVEWVSFTCIYTPHSFLMIPLLNFMHINIFQWSPVDSTLWPLDLLLYRCCFLPQTLCRTRPYYCLFNVNTLNWLPGYYRYVISLDIGCCDLHILKEKGLLMCHFSFSVICHKVQYRYKTAVF